MSVRHSMHKAVLSNCITSEMVQSLQSSDELKMHAWMEILLAFIITITLKGNLDNFKRGGSYKSYPSQGFHQVCKCTSTQTLAIWPWFPFHLCEVPRFSPCFLTTVSLKGHSKCIKNVFFLTHVKIWPLNDSSYQGSWTKKSIDRH